MGEPEFEKTCFIKDQIFDYNSKPGSSLIFLSKLSPVKPRKTRDGVYLNSCIIDSACAPKSYIMIRRFRLNLSTNYKKQQGVCPGLLVEPARARNNRGIPHGVMSGLLSLVYTEH